jgi:hypothetical protein
MTPSQWAEKRFGPAAAALQTAVVAGIAGAHADALAAQVAGGTPRQDPYGHTLKNRQYESLTEQVRAAELSGIDLIHPPRAFFDLVRLTDTNTVLFPWRFAKDRRLRREDARMSASRVRRDLLASTTEAQDQLSLEDAAVTDTELEAQLAERRALDAALRDFACVVTIGYASNLTGVFELGWGEAELVAEDGTVEWRHWEDLTGLLSTRAAGDSIPDNAGTGNGHAVERQVGGTRPGDLHVAATAPDEPGHRPLSRFDDAPLETGFGLQPRSPLAGEPQSEAPSQAEATDEEGDRL